jgi:nucleotidyltransferase substrate binding protein (TIGR01987 family)
MALDLTSLRRRIESLERAIYYANSRMNDNELTSGENEMIRAAIAQNFEFTYELCWKFMKRWLENNLTPGSMDGISRKELFRNAVEQKLIQDFSAWVVYHELRNTASHTYNPEVAEEIFEAATGFYADARAFLEVIEGKND